LYQRCEIYDELCRVTVYRGAKAGSWYIPLLREVLSFDLVSFVVKPEWWCYGIYIWISVVNSRKM